MSSTKSTKEIISTLLAEHDADIPRSAAQIQDIEINVIDVDDLPSFGWLANHVLGERLQKWDIAFDLNRRAAQRSDAPMNSHRHYAVAATFAGHPYETWRSEATIARLQKSSQAAAQLVVRMTVLQHAAPSLSTDELALALDLVCDQLRGVDDKETFGRAIASALNNSVSSWISRKEVPSKTSGDSFLAAAKACRDIWYRVGNWTNKERAEYLVALAGNAVNEHGHAKVAAEAGLAILATDGPEDVDKAFLLIELARSARALGDVESHGAALREARRLAEAFGDAGLKEWFEDQAAGL